MKIVELYAMLSSEDLNRFAQELGESKKVTRELHAVVSEQLEKNGTLELDKLYAALYGRQKNKTPLLRMHLTLLKKELERFVKKLPRFSDDHRNQLKLLRHYAACNAAKNFASLSKSLLAQLSREGSVSESALLLKHELIQMIIEWKAKDLTHNQKEILELTKQAMQCMDEYYVVYKMKNICSSINLQNISGQQLAISLQNEIVSMAFETTWNNLLLNAYLLIYTCLQNEADEKHYAAFEQFVAANASQFYETDRKEIFAFLQNYCIKKVNRGETAFISRLFSVYKLALEHNVLTEGNYLSARNFNNISRLALSLGETEWAQTFIDTHSNKLHNAERANTIAFNQSNIHFFKQEFENVQRVLRKVNLDDELYGINYRTLLAKTYYELDEYNLLDYLLESFDKFIRRRKGLGDVHRKNALTFIKLLKSLSRVKPYDKRAMKNLLQRMVQYNYIEKKWLLEKMEGLKTPYAAAGTL